MTEREIFAAALHMSNAAERIAFLDSACAGDTAIRERVEALLVEHEQLGSFLEAPSQGVTRDIIIERSGTQIGPYKLLEQIGEGGMGTVFMADQHQPIKRRVAIKIIKPGMDSRQVIARFEAERQALSLMDHPNIAKVLDAGTTDSGRPYFVMELVRGQPIIQYCDEHQLAPRERLQLLLPVCHAIQHAHQKGIIHRDIKPSNILVAEYDHQPVPKVIDFGVAKAISQSLTEKTMFTGFGQIVGTLEYMSPEQAKVNQLDIDTRSDIYSLGVLLYELLTGSTPFEKHRLRSAGWDEMLRIIREEEPPRPSMRLSGSGERLASISAQRDTEPNRLTKLIRGELDVIAMKALEKDRSRRYEAAAVLAADIQRYLNGEPVLAVPPTAAYRLWKIMRKHRVTLVTAGAFVALLLAGLAVTSITLVRALAAEKLAKDRLIEVRQANKTTQRALADTSLAKARTERALKASESARQRAREALEKLTDDVVHRLLGSRLQLTDADRAFLRDVVQLYEKFASGQGDSADVRRDRAQGMFRVSLIRKGLGELEESESALLESIRLRKQLVSEFPDAAEYRDELAQALGNLAVVRRLTGRTQEAMDLLKEAQAHFTQLAIELPSEFEYRHHLGINLMNVASLLSESGHFEAAEADYQKAIDLFEKLVAEFPDSSKAVRDLSQCQAAMGRLLQESNRLDEADAYLQRAIVNNQKLLHDYPDVPEYRTQLANIQNSLARVSWLRNKFPEAEAALREVISAQQRLAADYPALPECRRQLARTYSHMGVILVELQRHKEAEAAYRDAIKIEERLVQDFPDVPDYQSDLAGALCALAVLFSGGSQREAAEPLFEQSVDLYQHLVDDHAQVIDYTYGLAVALKGWARNKLELRDFAGALQLLERSQPHDQRALDTSPQQPEYLEAHRNQLWYHAIALLGLGDHVGASRKAGELSRFRTESLEDLYDAASLAARCSAVAQTDNSLSEDNRRTLAENYADQTMQLLTRLLKQGFDQPDVLAKDKHFAALFEQKDFQDLIRQLQQR